MTESSSITMIDYNKAFKKPPEALIQKKSHFDFILTALLRKQT